jgi:hypothetical protein
MSMEMWERKGAIHEEMEVRKRIEPAAAPGMLHRLWELDLVVALILRAGTGACPYSMPLRPEPTSNKKMTNCANESYSV